MRILIDRPAVYWYI